MNLTILLIEDEPQIRHFVRLALQGEGWQVHETASAKQGLIEATTRQPDLIILDLGLPDGDGMDFIRAFRQWSAQPIIVLSARVHELDKVTALDAGADDYLSKPFGIAELLARIRANARRQGISNKETVFQFGDIKVDLAARVVQKQGVDVHLTPIEYRLLNSLITQAGRVLTHRQLLREVWGGTHTQSSHYLRVYMSHLRQKLEDDPAQPRFIVTETGVGYRLIM
ncbi:response regulator with CheY-like receiver domain and winged-helix DNA-binding domain [Beggiatoa alba B18LD]|uniref:Response regulator with CheY-like receiver domain and winged-helix DNA-binding domain n=1 Tax=Beggiatoa alba B18LD TaxID=395493 RepID=I3CE76_9GAMM|nr:two-component system response regulator KdpE [Beggiatoa alba]EIJ41919.1 response regulator with CheY-like receiver domain and winged-helix DNA-binding domain [Beggiatoa alba B18LD]